MNDTQTLELPALTGRELGTVDVTYTESDAILYALAVGAAASELDLVYERDLRVLPTYGLALGLWAVEAAGRLGAYDPVRSLHAAQHLTVHRALPSSGTLRITGRVAAVWDKGSAAIVDVEASCPQFTATYSIFLPGYGGWGGERGPAKPKVPENFGTWRTEFTTSAEAAALYRLTGDRHPLHIDPKIAADSGFAQPILHGLCTLGIAARTVAAAAGAHPCELATLSARLAAPVTPGDVLRITAAADDGGTARFDTHVDGTGVLTQGTAEFG